MRRFFLCLSAVLPAAVLMAACATDPSQNDVTLQVGVADSFVPVMRELAKAYHSHQPWVKIELHEANTAKLEQDLKEGKAYDIYLPSRVTSMDALAAKDAINPQSRQLLALNQLTVISAPDSGMSLTYTELTNPNVRQIAVANPNSLLGYLTRQALTNMKMLPSHEATPLGQPSAPAASGNSNLPPDLAKLIAAQTVNLEPKLLVVANEDDVVAAVKDGRAQLGITYTSYVVNDNKVRILAPLELGSYSPVAYNVAIPRNAPHNDEAWQFLNYLRSAEAHAIMQREGLLVN